jgi:hypothetical protein
VGIWGTFHVVTSALVFAPVLVLGGFHPRFLLSLPIALSVGVCVAFMPINGSTAGILSVALLNDGLGFVATVLLLNVPFFATVEHKALDQSFGPPTVAIGFLFFGLITAYIMLTERYSNPLVGLLLPLGSATTRTLALCSLVRSCHKFYWEPKQAFLEQLPASAQSPAEILPPLLGDVEALFGYLTVFFALSIGNVASVATIVEVMLSPASKAWMLSLAASSLLSIATRTGVQQRVELWIAARLAARQGIQWPMRIAQTNALKLAYLHSLGGASYITPMMAVTIGRLRAITFGDPAAIVWLDVSQTVWRVLAAQLASGALADAIVRAVRKKELLHFELSARFLPGHPLCNTAFRDFDVKGYAVAFGMGGMFIYAVFVAFLGPTFLTGMCRDFAPNATQVWVWRRRECMNATAAAVWTNKTLPAV